MASEPSSATGVHPGHRAHASSSAAASRRAGRRRAPTSHRASRPPRAPRRVDLTRSSVAALAVVAAAGFVAAAVAGTAGAGLTGPLVVVALFLSAFVVSLLPRRSLAPVAVAALFVLPPVLVVAGRPGDEAPLKAMVILLAAAAVVKSGVTTNRLAFAWLGLWTTSLVVSVVGPDTFSLGVSGAANAFLGYMSGWAWLYAAVPASEITARLRAVEVSAAACVALGVVLDVAGVLPALYSDGSGIPRVAGSLIPPQLAMLAICGLIASMVRGQRGDTHRHWLWITVNAAICFGTVTRGAVLAAAVILLGHLVTSARRRDMARGRLAAVLLLGASALAAATAVALRNVGNSYEGRLNTSGREEAWGFYLEVARLHDWVGNGLGAASVANSVYRPFGVQEAFQSPHNEYIHLWLDVGIPLTIALFTVFSVLVHRALRAVLPATSATAVLVALLVFAFVDNPLSTIQFTAPLAIVAGAAGALRHRAVPRGHTGAENQRPAAHA